jgi:hypothetical protein
MRLSASAFIALKKPTQNATESSMRSDESLEERIGTEMDIEMEFMIMKTLRRQSWER